MSRTRAALAWAILAVLLNGCGTVSNFATGESKIYGGVREDFAFIQMPVDGPGIPQLVLAIFAVDLTLCLAMDTLTLPIALYLRQCH